MVLVITLDFRVWDVETDEKHDYEYIYQIEGEYDGIMYIRVSITAFGEWNDETACEGNPREVWDRTINEIKEMFESRVKNKNMVKFNELLQDNIGELFDIITEWISDLVNDTINQLGIFVLYP